MVEDVLLGLTLFLPSPLDLDLLLFLDLVSLLDSDMFLDLGFLVLSLEVNLGLDVLPRLDVLLLGLDVLLLGLVLLLFGLDELLLRPDLLLLDLDVLLLDLDALLFLSDFVLLLQLPAKFWFFSGESWAPLKCLSSACNAFFCFSFSILTRSS